MGFMNTYLAQLALENNHDLNKNSNEFDSPEFNTLFPPAQRQWEEKIWHHHPLQSGELKGDLTQAAWAAQQTLLYKLEVEQRSGESHYQTGQV